MTNTTDLTPSMYLVGRKDGQIEQFFVRITPARKLEYHVATDLVMEANDSDEWWWHRMIPDYMPPTWKGWPTDIKEPGFDG